MGDNTDKHGDTGCILIARPMKKDGILCSEVVDEWKIAKIVITNPEFCEPHKVAMQRLKHESQMVECSTFEGPGVETQFEVTAESWASVRLDSGRWMYPANRPNRRIHLDWLHVISIA
jgi:hypothetical protein